MKLLEEFAQSAYDEIHRMRLNAGFCKEYVTDEKDIDAMRQICARNNGYLFRIGEDEGGRFVSYQYRADSDFYQKWNVEQFPVGEWKQVFRSVLENADDIERIDPNVTMSLSKFLLRAFRELWKWSAPSKKCPLDDVPFPKPSDELMTFWHKKLGSVPESCWWPRSEYPRFIKARDWILSPASGFDDATKVEKMKLVKAMVNKWVEFDESFEASLKRNQEIRDYNVDVIKKFNDHVDVEVLEHEEKLKKLRVVLQGWLFPNHAIHRVDGKRRYVGAISLPKGSSFVDKRRSFMDGMTLMEDPNTLMMYMPKLFEPTSVQITTEDEREDYGKKIDEIMQELRKLTGKGGEKSESSTSKLPPPPPHAPPAAPPPAPTEPAKKPEEKPKEEEPPKSPKKKKEPKVRDLTEEYLALDFSRLLNGLVFSQTS